jgi:hypothetical protein
MGSGVRHTADGSRFLAMQRRPQCAKSDQFSPVAMTNVVARDGVVDLWGEIVNERQRATLKVAAEDIPGVKTVKDHMVWIEPNNGIVLEAPGSAMR